MASKPKFTQDICKLLHNNARLKEQVAGRLIHYWRDELKGGKSKICAVFLDGETCQNVLTAETWGDADKAHAETNLKPLLGEVVALENAKIVNKGRSTVYHGKQIKMTFDRSTVVKKIENNEKYGTALPLVTLATCSNLVSICTISLVVCIQTVSGRSLSKTGRSTLPFGGRSWLFETDEKAVETLRVDTDEIAVETHRVDTDEDAFETHQRVTPLCRVSVRP